MSDSYAPAQQTPYGIGPQATSLADVLELVLDKGIVIVGDIQVNLLDIELLTIKVRLLISSVDKAREMGINWWENDESLSSNPKIDRGSSNGDGDDLHRRLQALEEKVGAGSDRA